VNIRLF